MFLAILAWILIRARRAPAPGSVGRTIGKVFGAVGLANLALVVVIGLVAGRERSLTTWLIYPCCVFVLQGMAWLIAYGLRQRAWHAWVAFGWVVTAVTMAWFVTSPGYYILAAGFGLLLVCMTVPGRGDDPPVAPGGLSAAMAAFDIDKLDDVIHGRLRLGIMAYLADSEVASFNELKAVLKTTQGNLSIHLRKLEDAGYIAIDKSFLDRKPLTRARLTTQGRAAFGDYLTAIAKLVGEGKD